MNYLSIPRIYFSGEWTVSVATGNNTGELFTGDPSNPTVQQLLNFEDVVINPVTIDGDTPTDTELRQYLTIEDKKYGGQPINWNYYGSNTASFQTNVVGVDLGQGFSASDPLVGKTAGFLHTALCDLNPTGSQTTQMFTDAFILGDTALPDGDNVPEPHFSRWVWFFRNISSTASGDTAASGYFETKIPMDSAAWASLLATGSPAIVALHNQAQATGASELSVRYCLYLTTSTGINQIGTYIKKVGQVVGAIGNLGTADMWSYPVGRRLRGTTVSLPVPVSPKYPNGRKATPLAPALISVDSAAKRISLDLCTALPEDGLQGTRVDLGDLSFVLVNGETTTLVGRLHYADYSAESYRRNSGIADFYYVNHPDIEAALPGSDFQIWSSIYGIIFSEVDALETDQRDTYIHTGQKETIKVKVTRRGQPLAGATVYLSQYLITYTDESVATAVPSDQWLVSMPDRVEVLADGYATFEVTGLKTGQCGISFSQEPYPVGYTLNILNDGCGFVRILPVNDYSHYTDQQLLGQDGFQIIYDEVLRYYYLGYPVMQGIVDFSNYTIMTSKAVLQQLVTLTSTDKWRNFDYMPRTRELSDTRRDLLHRWCQVNYAALYPST